MGISNRNEVTHMKYYDKNDNQILEGMTIRHDEGDTEVVYASDDDLGVKANKGDYCTEIYPLYQFATKKEWTII